MKELKEAAALIGEKLLEFQRETGASGARITLRFEKPHPLFGHKFTLETEDESDDDRDEDE